MKSLMMLLPLMGIAVFASAQPRGTIKGATFNSVSVPSDTFAFAVGDIYNYQSRFMQLNSVSPLTEKIEHLSHWAIIPTPIVPPFIYLVQLYGVASVYLPEQRRYHIWAVGDLGDNVETDNFMLEGNGLGWKQILCPNVGTPLTLNQPNNILSSISIGSDLDTWAVGYYNSDDQTNMPVALHGSVNKSVWVSVNIDAPVTFNGAINSMLKSVSVVDKNNAWAVGYSWTNNFDSKTMQRANYTLELIEHWDGNKWSVMSPPSDPELNSRQLNGVFAINENDVWAVGSETILGSGTYILIEHWNGSLWEKENTRLVGMLNGVYATSTTDIWTVGTGNTSPLSTIGALILHSSGSTWKRINNPYRQKADCTLNSVSGNSRNNIWAVGGWGGYTIAEHWNGFSWRAYQTK